MTGLLLLLHLVPYIAALTGQTDERHAFGPAASPTISSVPTAGEGARRTPSIFLYRAIDVTRTAYLKASELGDVAELYRKFDNEDFGSI